MGLRGKKKKSQWRNSSTELPQSTVTIRAFFSFILSVALILGMQSLAGADTSTITVRHDITRNWGSGFQAAVTISNGTSSPIRNWLLDFDWPHNITNIWDATVKSHTRNPYQVGAPSWATDIAPQSTVGFGYVGAPGNSDLLGVPMNCRLNGIVCSFNLPVPVPTTTTTSTSTTTTQPPATTTTSTTKPPATTTTTTSTTQPAPPPAPGTTQIEFTRPDVWDTGYNGNVSIKNTGTSTISSWSLSFQLADKITSVWNGNLSGATPNYAVSNASWNSSIAPGQAVSFGFGASYSGPVGVPSNCRLNGSTCTFITSGTAPPSTTTTTTVSPTTTTTTTTTKPPATTTTNTPTSTTSTTTTAPPATTSTSTTTKPPATTTSTTTTKPPATNKKVVGYYTSWATYGRNYQVTDIPADKLTHINYAFANIGDDGRIVLGDPYADIDKFFPGDSWDAGALRGNFHQLQILRSKYPNLKVMISIGGWTWSGKFSDVALTAQSRQKFAASVMDFVKQYGFDGVDIDWEYPTGGGLGTNVARPEDKQNYTLMLQELRSQLTALTTVTSRPYALSIAAPAGPGNYQNIELAKVGQTLDWINLMTYDFHGGWDSATGHNAPLYPNPADPSPDASARTQWNTSAAVTGYLSAGGPASKIIVGVPFYGRGWQNVGPTNNGLFQPGQGASIGTWEPGMFDFKDLDQNYVSKNGYVRYWDNASQVPYLYNPAQRTFITYDDPQSIGLKSDYINSQNLGGAMLWELSADTSNNSLISALSAPLLSASSTAVLMPNSK